MIHGCGLFLVPDTIVVFAFHQHVVGARQIACEIQRFLGFLPSLLLVSELGPRPRQHGVTQRKLRLRLRRLLEQVLCGHRIKLSKLPQAQRIKPRGIGIQRQRRNNACLVGVFQRRHSQPVSQFGTDARDQAEQVLRASDFRNLCQNLARARILHANVEPYLAATGVADDGIGAQNQRVAAQCISNSRGRTFIQSVCLRPR